MAENFIFEADLWNSSSGQGPQPLSPFLCSSFYLRHLDFHCSLSLLLLPLAPPSKVATVYSLCYHLSQCYWKYRSNTDKQKNTWKEPIIRSNIAASRPKWNGMCVFTKCKMGAKYSTSPVRKNAMADLSAKEGLHLHWSWQSIMLANTLVPTCHKLFVWWTSGSVPPLSW